MNVDELFKPHSSAVKRKYEASDAEQIYKSAKLNNGESPNANRATVEEGDENDDVEAGPSLPPGDQDEDEEGRFFGGGVTKDTEEAMEYIDQQDGEEITEERIDSAWLRRLATTFEKKVAKNSEMRAKYDGQPQKFMGSEADLDAEVKSWSMLGEHPELFEEFAESGSAASLVGLLAHENTDIAIGAIEIISELLDEDVEAEVNQWDALVNALLEADLLELLMSNLKRLDETLESDRSGVYHSLAVMESLSGQQAIAEKVGQEKVLLWLCKRITNPESPLGQNKQYAAEVLQVLLQSSPLLRKRLALDVDGVDLFLQLLAAYRKRDPAKDSLEEEFAENLFDALTCTVDEPDGKTRFIEAEGVELCLIMLKEGSMSKLRALRVLDHAMGGQSQASANVCEKFVDAAGLKTIFSTFMKKSDNTTIEHILGVFSSLLRLLPGESAARIRTLAKFLEKDGEKINKLIKLRLDYAEKAAASEDDDIAVEFCLRSIDVILAWLVAEEKTAKDQILKHIQADVLKHSLTGQMEDLDPDAPGEADTQEMLSTLASFL
ncbi:Hypothetical protein R9X50_00733600 [Acrodontium crateriforme]|uniref:Beta-catenin-like protein 1 N-terminal domain-containing protein n=1 Tax=Acrodontium crateriforme TaxID=150365 RepID=A0AAQ3MB74_9PEZI|nr:Hypothetical protein R9X50_00733600 [Acrodontium crateriforme]